MFYSARENENIDYMCELLPFNLKPPSIKGYRLFSKFNSFAKSFKNIYMRVCVCVYVTTNFSKSQKSLLPAFQILYNPVDVLNGFWSKWHEREISPSTTAHKHLK